MYICFAISISLFCFYFKKKILYKVRLCVLAVISFLLYYRNNYNRLILKENSFIKLNK